MRVVHYLNQFQAGVGGEDAASTPPQVHDELVGPSRLLARLLEPGGEQSGDAHEVVASISCGDDHAASDPGVMTEVLRLAREVGAEMIVAGPAFGSGRYGLACGRLVAGAAAEGMPAIAGMHPDNPGVDQAGGAVVVAAGASTREMRPSMERLAAAALKVAAGEPVTAEDGRVGRIPRRTTTVEQPAAVRAVDLALARLAGDRDATEIPAGLFDVVSPAGPVEDPAEATIALVTEGALVPAGNPDRLEAARATRWVHYPLDGVTALAAGDYESVHGGFSPAAANADPHRILPLDVARELEEQGRIGALHHEYLATAGNGTAVANARRFGVEWAARLHGSGVQAAILTAT